MLAATISIKTHFWGGDIVDSRSSFKTGWLGTFQGIYKQADALAAFWHERCLLH